ncbi:MAG: carboxypeptidase-like regulatory domain-containing protein [Flavobacterium sp.]
MKQTITILFLLLFCNVYCQKWYLHSINAESDFKYEYWFQFENKDDNPSYNFEKTEGNSISTIKLTDNKGEAIIFARINIKNLDNGALTNLFTDSNGKDELILKSGRYNIEITAMNYDNLSFNFSISEHEIFKLNAKLGLSPQLTVYQINSKNELKEDEIIKIMNCVKVNGGRNFYERCSDNKRFYVSMQI